MFHPSCSALLLCLFVLLFFPALSRWAGGLRTVGYWLVNAAEGFSPVPGHRSGGRSKASSIRMMLMTISISLGLGTIPALVISGTPEVGKTLQLSPVMLEGPSPMTYAVAWLRSGTPIAGADRATYTITPEDIGHSLSLRLTKPDGTLTLSSNTITVPAPEAQLPAHTVTVADASRNKIIYDTNAAWGGNSATIPLSGTSDAPAGTPVLAEIVRDTDGTVLGSEIQIATVDGFGNWSGSYTGMVRRPEWLRARVRVQNSTAPKVSPATVFGTGHVITFWGQSEIQNITLAFYNGQAAPAPLSADEMVSFHWHNRTPGNTGAGGVRHHLAVQGTTSNTRFAAMANSLMAARPGEKFAVVFQTASGTGMNQLVNDSTSGRYWIDDKALHDAVGVQPGIIAFSWFASPRGYGNGYGAAIHEMIYGKTLAGVSLGTPPVDTTSTALGVNPTDHFLTELYDFSASTGTRVAVLEPHRFVQDGNIPECRNGVRTLYANSSEPSLVYAPAVGGYQNGYRNGPDSWTDGTHPQPGEGSIRFSVGLVQSAIRAMGLTAWDLPEIDQAYWEPSGAYVELWSTAGPISAVDPSQVVGVEIDNSLVTAAIVNGRIRVTAADIGTGTPFTGNTQVRFAYNTTGLNYHGPTGEQVEESGWQHYPLVDVGVPGLSNGWPLRNMPPAQVLASTIPADPKFTTTGNVRITDISDMLDNPGNSPLTVRMVMKVNSVSSANTFFSYNSGSFTTRWEVLPNGAIRYSRPSSGSSTTPAGTMPIGSFSDFLLTFHPATGVVRAWLNGTQILSHTDNSWTWPAYQFLRLLSAFDDGGGIHADVESLTLWREYTPDGSVAGFASPYKAIAGDEAMAIGQASAAPTFAWHKNGVRQN